MERDRLAPTLIMTTGIQSPKVPRAATDACAVTRVRTALSSRIGEPCEGEPIPYTIMPRLRIITYSRITHYYHASFFHCHYLSPVHKQKPTAATSGAAKVCPHVVSE
jgi:hypothetical protein